MNAPGSVLVSLGRTAVLCTCCVEPAVPPFLVGTGKGWLTAEYSMLPGSTPGRKARDKGGKVDGRSVEIQRLIGRALRAVVNLDDWRDMRRGARHEHLVGCVELGANDRPLQRLDAQLFPGKSHDGIPSDTDEDVVARWGRDEHAVLAPGSHRSPPISRSMAASCRC